MFQDGRSAMVDNGRSKYIVQRKLDSVSCPRGATISGKIGVLKICCNFYRYQKYMLENFIFLYSKTSRKKKSLFNIYIISHSSWHTPLFEQTNFSRRLTAALLQFVMQESFVCQFLQSSSVCAQNDTMAKYATLSRQSVALPFLVLLCRNAAIGARFAYIAKEVDLFYCSFARQKQLHGKRIPEMKIIKSIFFCVVLSHTLGKAFYSRKRVFR